MKNLFLIFSFLCFNHFGFSQGLPSVGIGNQFWSSVNFNGLVFRNGDAIKEAKTKEEWLRLGYREEAAWCYYGFDSKNQSLGKLYNYYAISDPRNIAPVGWEVPDFIDFFNLVNYLDPLNTPQYFVENGSLAGGSLKSKNLNDWTTSECEQISSGYNAVGAGGYSPSLDYPSGDWKKLKEAGYFWLSTDWKTIAEYIGGDSKDKILNNYNLTEKAVVFRLRNDNCKIDADDDPKINGYYLRLIKK